MNGFTAFLAKHDIALLLFCSALFGFAWGLGHANGLVPSPWWFTPSIYRFCIVLMIWTALLNADPLQRLLWTATDFVALTLPYTAGQLFVPDMPLSSVIDYWLTLGKVSGAAVFGVAVTQAVYSLLPDWRASWVRAQPQEDVSVDIGAGSAHPDQDASAVPTANQVLAALVESSVQHSQALQPLNAYYIDEPLTPTETEQVLELLQALGEGSRRTLVFKRIPYVFLQTKKYRLVTSTHGRVLNNTYATPAFDWGQAVFLSCQEKVTNGQLCSCLPSSGLLATFHTWCSHGWNAILVRSSGVSG